jgi:esterase/lipase superfamily enzyme
MGRPDAAWAAIHAPSFAPDAFDDDLPERAAAAHVRRSVPGIVYFNTPALPPQISDPWLSDRYRRSIIVSAGQGPWDEDMLADARTLESILREKGVPAWIDVWGHDVSHDWPWWRRQMPYFLHHLGL